MSLGISPQREETAALHHPKRPIPLQSCQDQLASRMECEPFYPRDTESYLPLIHNRSIETYRAKWRVETRGWLAWLVCRALLLPVRWDCEKCLPPDLVEDAVDLNKAWV